MNNFHEFIVGGCAVDLVFIIHRNCGWSWDTDSEMPFSELVKVVADHKCEEKPK